MKEKEHIICEFKNGVEICPDCGGICTYVESLHNEPSLTPYYYLYFKCGLTLLLEKGVYTVIIICQADIPIDRMKKDRLQRHIRELMEKADAQF